MKTSLTCALGFIIAAIGECVALGQLPRLPVQAVELEYREFPFPVGGHNFGFSNVIALSKDGRILATAAASSIVVWDVQSRKIVAQMQLTQKQRSINLAFTEDAKTLISFGEDEKTIRFWDVKTGQQTRERPLTKDFKAAPGRLQPFPMFLGFGPDARTMAISADRQAQDVQIVETDTGALKAKWDDISLWRGNWAYANNGERFAASPVEESIVKIWDARTSALVRTIRTPTRNSDRQEGYAFLKMTHDGKLVFGEGNDPARMERSFPAVHTTIWGADDGLEYCLIPDTRCRPSVISRDERMLIATDLDGLFVFDLLADKKIRIKNPPPNISNIQPSADGKTLALLGRKAGVPDSPLIFLTSLPVLGDDTIPEGQLTAADLADLWTGACGSNLFRRRYVTKVLKAHPDQAVSLVGDKVKPVSEKERRRVVDLIGNLDDEKLEHRDAATKELSAYAFRFEPLLSETIKKAPAGEIRNRVTSVLNSIAGRPIPSDVLADVRGIEILKSLSTTAARSLLEKLASGAAESRTTVDAAAALRRAAP